MTAVAPPDASTGAGLLDRQLSLDEQAALRPEPFGALAYHYGTRRLIFLRDRQLAEVVADLGAHPSLRAAFDAHAVGDDRRAAFVAAIDGLLAAGVLR